MHGYRTTVDCKSKAICANSARENATPDDTAQNRHPPQKYEIETKYARTEQINFGIYNRANICYDDVVRG